MSTNDRIARLTKAAMDALDANGGYVPTIEERHAEAERRLAEATERAKKAQADLHGTDTRGFTIVTCSVHGCQARGEHKFLVPGDTYYLACGQHRKVAEEHVERLHKMTPTVHTV